MLKATLNGIDNNNLAVDFVHLGAQLVDTGTRGTIYFDDFESRRFSEIGLLPDPGIQNPTPTPVSGWDNVTYTYGDPDHVHAVGFLLPVIGPLRAGAAGRHHAINARILPVITAL